MEVDCVPNRFLTFAFIKVLTNSHLYFVNICGPGSSVGIATELRAGRSGDRIPVGGEIFRPSRPVLGPTQPPVQWVPGFSPG
jgi:hypothetical protein